MAKIWKKSMNRIIDRERKLEIPYDHFVYAEPVFFTKYGSSFSKTYDHPPKGAHNVLTINWTPPAPAPVLPEPASVSPEPPKDAPADAPTEEAPAAPSQPEDEAPAPSEPPAEEPKAAPEKKAKGKGKK